MSVKSAEKLKAEASRALNRDCKRNMCLEMGETFFLLPGMDWKVATDVREVLGAFASKIYCVKEMRHTKST